MNISEHRRVLLNILQKIYKHPKLAATLGFKGGTSLYFLHELPRFSVDLDFNLIDEDNKFSSVDLDHMLEEDLTINDVYNKQNTWLWNGVYESGQWNVKIEVSKRQYDDTYELKDLYGLSMNVLSLDCQLSHKLCAITDRTSLVNRDIFDVHFLLNKNVDIVDSIIEERTGMSAKKYLEHLLKFIPENISKRGVLDGLGELLDDESKKRAKSSLLDETMFLISSRLDEY